MNALTPHSMHSSIAPYDQQSKHSCSVRRPYYPATPQPEPPSMQQSGNALGIFDCPLPPPQTTVQQLPPSPQPSDSWSHSSMMEQDYPHSSQQPPDIFSAAFDPFSGFSSDANTAMMAAPSPEAPGLVFCQTPPSTNLPSHRSSISSSSYSDTESYSQHGSEYYTPKVKMEDGNEWYPAPGNDQVLQRSLTTQGLSPYSTGVSPINGPNDDWSKTGPGAYRVDFHPMTGEELRSRFEAAPIVPSVNRIKKKRQRTTPEEATHECRVCGKLFKRSYNWKSHMETHNPERKYPHPCTAMIGGQPCTKKFQRKTDLDRHHDSVHLKARNHRCGLCGNRFARRDTLRRHTEDGCPKRFELGYREGSAAAPARWSLPTFAERSMAPPMSAFASYTRPDFVSSPLQTQTASGFAS